MKIESWWSPEDRRRWKIVRTDDYADIPGLIIEADELTGEARLENGSETNNVSLGSRGFRLVARTRSELAAIKAD